VNKTEKNNSNFSSPGISKKVKKILSEGSSQKDLMVNFQNREAPKTHNWMKVVYEAFCEASEEVAFPLNKELMEFFICDFLDKVCFLFIYMYNF
jgi:hypothetical protein